MENGNPIPGTIYTQFVIVNKNQAGSYLTLTVDKVTLISYHHVFEPQKKTVVFVVKITVSNCLCSFIVSTEASFLESQVLYKMKF